MITSGLCWIHSDEWRALPSPTVQAANIVRFIGDCVSRSSELIGKFPVELPAIIGALNRESAVRLMVELNERGILAARGNTKYIGGRYGADPLREPANVNLTLDGWQQYESQKRGSFEGKLRFHRYAVQREPWIRLRSECCETDGEDRNLATI